MGVGLPLTAIRARLQPFLRWETSETYSVDNSSGVKMLDSTEHLVEQVGHALMI